MEIINPTLPPLVKGGWGIYDPIKVRVEDFLKTQRSADIAGGCFLVLLGLATIIAATKITGGVEERLPPRTLPYVVGIIILISGGLLAIRPWRFRGEDPVIKWPGRRGTIRVLITIVSLGVYLALMDPLGLPLSTFLYVSFAVWVAIIFGVIGYFMRKLGYPIAPMVLATVLAQMLETSLQQSLLISQGSPMIFITRPISAVFIGLAILSLVRGVWKQVKSHAPEIAEEDMI